MNNSFHSKFIISNNKTTSKLFSFAFRFVSIIAMSIFALLLICPYCDYSLFKPIDIFGNLTVSLAFYLFLSWLVFITHVYYFNGLSKNSKSNPTGRLLFGSEALKYYFNLKHILIFIFLDIIFVLYFLVQNYIPSLRIQFIIDTSTKNYNRDLLMVFLLSLLGATIMELSSYKESNKQKRIALIESSNLLKRDEGEKNFNLPQKFLVSNSLSLFKNESLIVFQEGINTGLIIFRSLLVLFFLSLLLVEVNRVPNGYLIFFILIILASASYLLFNIYLLILIQFQLNFTRKLVFKIFIPTIYKYEVEKIKITIKSPILDEEIFLHFLSRESIQLTEDYILFKSSELVPLSFAGDSTITINGKGIPILLRYKDPEGIKSSQIPTSLNVVFYNSPSFET